MIQYKRMSMQVPPDKLEIQVFCAKHEALLPSENAIVFGAHDNGQLIGISCLKVIHQIEPLIVDDGYPRVVQVLSEKTIAIASVATNEIVIFIPDSCKTFLDVLQKYGFIVMDSSITILKKEI